MVYKYIMKSYDYTIDIFVNWEKVLENKHMDTSLWPLFWSACIGQGGDIQVVAWPFMVLYEILQVSAAGISGNI